MRIKPMPLREILGHPTFHLQNIVMTMGYKTRVKNWQKSYRLHPELHTDDKYGYGKYPGW